MQDIPFGLDQWFAMDEAVRFNCSLPDGTGGFPTTLFISLTITVSLVALYK